MKDYQSEISPRTTTTLQSLEKEQEVRTALPFDGSITCHGHPGHRISMFTLEVRVMGMAAAFTAKDTNFDKDRRA